MPRDNDYPEDGAASFLPERRSLTSLRKAVPDCRGCDLYRDATQAVFGAGSAKADLVLIGEQPGDVEDRQGRPFVGPAGKLLDRALAEAGIDPSTTYRTNVVKHFRFRGTKGKRRIHQTPSTWQVAACQPWVLAELDAIRPSGVVVLGATAGKSLLGSGFRITATRGHRLDAESLPADWVVPTVHPSSVLRSPERDVAYADLVKDLEVAADALAG